MTAEIAIMNKNGVALAADSAVSMSWGQEAKKIYNSANKLFALSDCDPVGIMVYASSEFMGVPWELIIKHYRLSRSLRAPLQHLEQYAEDFRVFLESEKCSWMYPSEARTRYFQRLMASLFDQIRSKTVSLLRQATDAQGLTAEEAMGQVIQECYRYYLSRPDSEVISDEDVTQCLEEAEIDWSQLELPIANAERKMLSDLPRLALRKDAFLDETGVVIAGFGSRDVFPSLFGFRVQGLVNRHLKWGDLTTEAVTFDRPAVFVPFAQDSVVKTFMAGMDPSVKAFAKRSLTNTMNAYSRLVGESLQEVLELSDEDKEQFVEQLKKTVTPSTVSELMEELEKYTHTMFEEPVLKAVAGLPKDELASVAEALINLTTLRRRISMDSETVGGPVDVAVISRAEGFIWIKRKHYFDAKLNPAFMARYYGTCIRIGGGSSEQED